MTALSPWELAYCAGVIFLAYGLRGSTGFGAVIGMPLLALVLPLKLLVPVWTLLGFASSATIVARDYRHVARDAVVAFMPWCLLGIAIGLFFFTQLDSRMLGRALGVTIIGYAAYSTWNALRQPGRALALPPITGPLSATVSGMVGAVFGTMGSLFFVVFLDARGLARDKFRATMSAMLLLLSAVRGIGYYAVGEFTLESLLMFGAAFPAMLAGIYLGDRVQMNFDEATFRRVVCATLLLCGLTLLLK